jgi:hypothetical protein
VRNLQFAPRDVDPLLSGLPSSSVARFLLLFLNPAYTRMPNAFLSGFCQPALDRLPPMVALPSEDFPEAEDVVGSAGSIVLFTAGLLHAARNNTTPVPRVAHFFEYVARFVRPMCQFPASLLQPPPAGGGGRGSEEAATPVAAAGPAPDLESLRAARLAAAFDIQTEELFVQLFPGQPGSPLFAPPQRGFVRPGRLPPGWPVYRCGESGVARASIMAGIQLLDACAREACALFSAPDESGCADTLRQRSGEFYSGWHARL